MAMVITVKAKEKNDEAMRQAAMAGLFQFNMLLSCFQFCTPSTPKRASSSIHIIWFALIGRSPHHLFTCLKCSTPSFIHYRHLILRILRLHHDLNLLTSIHCSIQVRPVSLLWKKECLNWVEDLTSSKQSGNNWSGNNHIINKIEPLNTVGSNDMTILLCHSVRLVELSMEEYAMEIVSPLRGEGNESASYEAIHCFYHLYTAMLCWKRFVVKLQLRTGKEN